MKQPTERERLRMTFAPNKLNRAILLAMLTAGLAACGGEDGKDGKDGVNGTNGVDGQSAVQAPGAPGADGKDGQDGTNGQNGTDGKDAIGSGPGPFGPMKFAGVSAPQTDYAKRSITVSTSSIGDDVYGGAYNTFARSGDDVNGVYFGQLVDENGSLLQEDDGTIVTSNSNEFTSLLPIGDRLFSVSQFESRPGAMFLMELDQNKINGELSVKSLSQIDQSGVNGGWVHCAGSVTPWVTHLASEEYEPNARTLVTSVEAEADGYTSGMLDYYTDRTQWNPYFYGWNIEVAVDEAANTALTKHYAMGRMAFELSYVMPDAKTTYMTDDGTNVGLYMFVADTAEDLSTGTTYVAKWSQTSADGMGEYDLSWISLGHATDAEIQTYIDNGTTFADIFEVVDATNGICPENFTSINAGGNGQECLQVKSGMEQAASRLETRRYAAMLGGTTELRKEEGITFDPKRNKVYLAISEIARGMEDFKKNGSFSTSYDLGGANDLRLADYNKCGGVYQLDVATNAEIGSDYVIQNAAGLVAGRPVSESDPQAVGFEQSNSCHIDGIANPDNVTYMSGYDYLIIGEDTGSGHQNDVIWAYDFTSEALTRIQTTPYGAETTSPYWYPNINGWAYMTSVVQHPYGESDGNKNTGAGENRAYTGYIGPFPAVTVE